MKYILTTITDWGRVFYNSEEHDIVSDIAKATLFDTIEEAESKMFMFKHYLSQFKHLKHETKIMKVSAWSSEIKPGCIYSSRLFVSQD